MGHRLAIVIAVPEYSDRSMDLPGCVKDAEVISKILRATAWPTDILEVAGAVPAAEVKRKLVDFVSRHQGEEVDAVFFYFTGHGDFIRNDVYLLLSDFEKKASRLTALQNSEIDALIKSLAPALAVKVVDACHSGAQYVKDVDALKKAVEDNKGQFQHVYFMFSSMLSQASFQSDTISAFTDAFARAVVHFTGKDIRYKDIIDYISDAFDGDPDQTPFFVLQGALTEVFASIPDDIGAVLATPELAPAPEANKAVEERTESLVQLIQADAARFVEKDQAARILEEDVLAVAKLYPFTDEYRSLYDYEVSASDGCERGIPVDRVAKWLSDHDHALFAAVGYVPETYQVEEPLSLSSVSPYASIGRSAISALLEGRSTHMVTKTRRRPAQVLPAPGMPFASIALEMRSKYPNLTSYRGVIIVLVSRTHLRIFSAIAPYHSREWDQARLEESAEWRTSEVLLADAGGVETTVMAVVSEWEVRILNAVRDRFSPTPSLPNGT